MQISHRPDEERGWLELSAGGLAFDLTGLSPAPPVAIPQLHHMFYLPEDIDQLDLEAVVLGPGAHTAGGGACLPVVRVMLGIAANLALHLPITAICWNPAGSWMDPRYFARLMLNWLAGGQFPALGLTPLTPRPDGRIASTGLAFFTGQEIVCDPVFGETQADTIKLAAAVIDHLANVGTIDQVQAFEGAEGEPLLIELADYGRLLHVRRG